MMYIHFCTSCNSIHILNGHKVNCPRCGQQLKELKISFAEYTSLSKQQRLAYKTTLSHNHMDEST